MTDVRINQKQGRDNAVARGGKAPAFVSSKFKLTLSPRRWPLISIFVVYENGKMKRWRREKERRELKKRKRRRRWRCTSKIELSQPEILTKSPLSWRVGFHRQRTIKTSLILDSDPLIAMQLFHPGAQLWVHSVRVNGLCWKSTCGQTHHALWQPQVKVKLVNVWSSLGVISVLFPWCRVWLLCARLNVEEKKMRAPRDGNTYQDRRQDDRGNRGSQDNLRGAGHPGGRGLSWTWFAGFLTPTLLGGGGDRGRGDRGGRGGGRWAISGSTSPTWYLHQMI